MISKVNLYHLLLGVAFIFLLSYVYTRIVDNRIDPDVLAQVKKENPENLELLEKNQVLVLILKERGWFFLLFSALALAIILWMGLSNRRLKRGTTNADRDRLREKLEKRGMRSLEFQKRLRLSYSSLTDHDLRVAKMLVEGLSSKEISFELNISPASVNSARYRLRKRMELSPETDLLDVLRQI